MNDTDRSTRWATWRKERDEMIADLWDRGYQGAHLKTARAGDFVAFEHYDPDTGGYSFDRFRIISAEPYDANLLGGHHLMIALVLENEDGHRTAINNGALCPCFVLRFEDQFAYGASATADELPAPPLVDPLGGNQ
jgi:hypothetical protein